MEAVIPISLDNDVLIIMFIVICIIIVAFFSSSEAALMSVNKLKIKHLIEKGNKNAAAVDRIISRHDKLFGTILTTENLFIILASSLGTALSFKYFGSDGVFISTLIMTVLIVILGEITPKTIAAALSERISLMVARPMELIIKIMNPIITVFALLSNVLLKTFGAKIKYNPYYLTEDEIKTVIDVGEKEGVLAADEKEILYGVFELGDKLAKEIMVPRVEMECVEISEALSGIVEAINKTGHSRIPVYEGNLDNIVGVVYVKDLLTSLEDGKSALTAGDLKRPAFFAPFSRKIIGLFNELQQNKQSMVILLDEFGGTAGLITMEMILEEIVGEISDEYDTERMYFNKISNKSYLIDARYDIESIMDKIDIEIPEGDYNTIGGFVTNKLGRIPKAAEKVELKNAVLIVEKVFKNRIDIIRIEIK